MTLDYAKTVALAALAYILGEDALRDRFLALTGMDGTDMRARIEDTAFLASVLEFLMGHDPDLLAFAAHAGEKPESVGAAWRALGGAEGREW